MAENSGIGLAMGAAFGLVAGAALGNAGLGMIFGAAVGIVFGAGFPPREHTSPSPDGEESDATRE